MVAPKECDLGEERRGFREVTADFNHKSYIILDF